jgi:hypothetical protein
MALHGTIFDGTDVTFGAQSVSARARDAAESKSLRRESVHQVTGNSAMPRKKGCG